MDEYNSWNTDMTDQPVKTPTCITGMGGVLQTDGETCCYNNTNPCKSDQCIPGSGRKAGGWASCEWDNMHSCNQQWTGAYNNCCCDTGYQWYPNQPNNHGCKLCTDRALMPELWDYDPATQVNSTYTSNTHVSRSILLDTNNLSCDMENNKSCTSFDPVKTCQLAPHGKNGKSTVLKEWPVKFLPNGQVSNYLPTGGEPPVKNPHAGKVACNYSYDFTNFNFETDMGDLHRWLKGTIQGTNDSTTGVGLLPQHFSRHLIDVSIISININNFYTQLYQNINGSFRTSSSPLTVVDTIKKQIISTQTGQLSDLYTILTPPLKIPTAFAGSPGKIAGSSIYEVMKMPVPSLNANGKYEIIFYFSTTQYESASENQDMLAVYYNFFFNDKSSTITTNSSTIIPIDPGLTRITPSEPDSIITIHLEPPYETRTFLTSAVLPNYFICSYGVSFEVKTWSPVLFMYFKYNLIRFPKQVLEKVHADTKMLPVALFDINCNIPGASTFPKGCTTDLSKYCSYSYNAPGNMQKTQISKYLITTDSSDCLCTNSEVSPNIEYGEHPEATMCFSTACDHPKYTSGYNLTDKNCAQYCELINGWITSTNPATRSSDLDDLNADKYNRVCGKDFHPYSTGTLRVEILVIGIGISLTLLFLLFSSIKRYNISTGKRALYLTITGILTVGISIFLAIDLQGNPVCDKNVSTCKSRITGIPINKQFCDFMIPCECSFNENCKGCGDVSAGKCASGLCISSGRKEGTITVTEINYTYLITSCILLVLLPLVLYTIYTSYVKLNIEILLPTIALVLAIPSLLLSKTFNKKPIRTYTKTCTGATEDLSRFHANWNNVIIIGVSTCIVILCIALYKTMKI